jgi:hypothetical protein
MPARPIAPRMRAHAAAAAAAKLGTRAAAAVTAAAAVAALGAAACYRQPVAPPPPPVSGGSAVEDAGWPSSLEFEMAEKQDVLKHRGLAMFSIEARVPVFRSEPPATAAALNARLARFARPEVDPRTHEGAYQLECSVELANRYAVILSCSQLLDERTHEEAAQGVGGAPGDPRRLVMGWWLRRGLPDLSLEQFAPRFDLRSALDAAVSSAPAGCDLRACAFDPKSFLIDSEGITPVATESCSEQCDVVIPSVPLDQLAPTHAWAVELVKRVRRRVDAGDGLVEGDRSN